MREPVALLRAVDHRADPDVGPHGATRAAMHAMQSVTPFDNVPTTTGKPLVAYFAQMNEIPHLVRAPPLTVRRRPAGACLMLPILIGLCI